MILKTGKNTMIEQIASVNKEGKLNNFNYFRVYYNKKIKETFTSYVEALKKFNELEQA